MIEFVIDRVNSEVIRPLKLKNISESMEGEELLINDRIKIKMLLNKFEKGINTIEIADNQGEERIASRLIIDIEI